MIALVMGGAKSGKSMYAQNLSKSLESKEGKLYYIATMNPYDLEDFKRIENHLIERDGYGFETIEQQRNIEIIINKITNEDTLMLDSITSLVTNEMFVGKEFNEFVEEKIIEALKMIIKHSKNLIIVSDYVFSDGIIYDSYTERFRRNLGRINRRIAEVADIVVECSFGNVIYHKGEEDSRGIK